jgi:ammonia channel protein AmtB
MKRPVYYVIFHATIAMFYVSVSFLFIGYGISLWDNANSIFDVIFFVIFSSLWVLFVASTKSILDEDY